MLLKWCDLLWWKSSIKTNKQTNKRTNQHTKSVEAEWITWPLLPWEGPLRRWSCRRRASRWSTGRRCYEAEAFHAFILVSMAHFFLAEANIGALVQLLWIRSRLLAAASKYFSKVVFFFKCSYSNKIKTWINWLKDLGICGVTSSIRRRLINELIAFDFVEILFQVLSIFFQIVCF